MPWVAHNGVSGVFGETRGPLEPRFFAAPCFSLLTCLAGFAGPAWDVEVPKAKLGQR